MTATARLPVEGRLPDLDGATDWLNSAPLTPKGLRGRVVVVEDLQAKGHRVTAPQFPLTSLADDVARLRQALAWQRGPTVVVGRSGCSPGASAVEKT